MPDDGLEVGDAEVERCVVDVAVGEAVAALVEAVDGRNLAQLGEVVPPDRALPVVLQVAEPARVDDQRRPEPWTAYAIVTSSTDRQKRTSCRGVTRAEPDMSRW